MLQRQGPKYGCRGRLEVLQRFAALYLPRTSLELLHSVSQLVSLDHPSYITLSRLDYGSRTGLHCGITAAEQDGSDVCRARGHIVVQLGPEHHDQGPVPNLGLWTDVQLAHTTAAGGGGGAVLGLASLICHAHDRP